MTFRVFVTPNAEADLRRARAFIQKDSRAAASRWLQAARRAVQTLARNPMRCPLAPESAVFNEPIRELLFGRGNRGTYRMLFVVIDTTVYVLHVRYGSRDTAESFE